MSLRQRAATALRSLADRLDPGEPDRDVVALLRRLASVPAPPAPEPYTHDLAHPGCAYCASVLDLAGELGRLPASSLRWLGYAVTDTPAGRRCAWHKQFSKGARP